MRFQGARLLTIVGIAAPAAALAQDAGAVSSRGPEAVQPEVVRMVVVAAEHAYGLLAENTVGLPARVAALDRRVLVVPAAERARRGGPHDEAFLAGVAESLNASLTDLDDALRCPRGPRSCELEAATVVFVIGLPEIRSSTARVPVEIVHEVTVGDWPVLRTGWIVTVERDWRGEWRPVEVEMRWTT